MKNKHWILVMILILSGFIHLLNPVGFPDIFFDEGVYMRRAMHVIQEGNPQEAYLYDHPYFGQILLAGAMKLVGFPDSLNSNTDVDSLKELYMAPRIFMGLLAVLDTFLVYRIAEKKYSKNVAIIASVLFAVMPFSWIFKRILLDSLLLPFLLGSILVALHAKDSQKSILIVSSGILLGLAVFTKIPAVMFVFLVGLLIYQSRKRLKDIAIWFAPVFLIPSLWVLHAVQLGQFDLWINDVLWQAGRSSGGLGNIIVDFWNIDPILLAIGMAGLIYAAYKRDYFVILWIVPMLVFLGTIGYTQYFHWIPLIPVFSIAGAALIIRIVSHVQTKTSVNIFYVVFAGIVVVGTLSSSFLIVTDSTSAQFATISFVLEHTKNNNDVTILSSPTYSWIFDKIFEKENVPLDYSHVLYYDTPTEKILVVSDIHLIYDLDRGKQLREVYENTETIRQFESDTKNISTETYPFGSFSFNDEGATVQIRTNYEN